MGYGRRALFEDQRQIAFGSIIPGYSLVGTTFDHPIRMLMVFNQTDALLQFSMNGVDDHFVLDAGMAAIYDFASNRVQDYAFFFGKGDGVYVEQIGVPTTGNVYVSAIYGKGD